MITPERKHELAVELGVLIAKHALATTVAASLFPHLIDTDDIGSLPPTEFAELCDELAALIRTGDPIVTYPELYVGKGDGEPVGTPDDEQPTIDNPEGWEDSWDRERAANYEKWREGEDSAGRGTDDKNEA